MQPETESQYKKIAQFLAGKAREGELRSVFFTAADSRLDKSSVLVPVARMLVRDCGLKPLIVEINRTRPVYLSAFGFDSGQTVEFLEAGSLGPKQCVHKDEFGVGYIPAGGSPEWNGNRRGVSAVLRCLLQQLGPLYDLVLVDAPSPVESPEGLEVTGVVSNAVLIVGSGRTNVQALEKLKERLVAEKVGILGAILSEHRVRMPRWVDRWLGS